MERRRFLIDDIHIGDNRRKPDTKKVEEIAKSIRDVGIMNPPAVCIRNDVIMSDGEVCDAVPVLIYGRHRLLALMATGEDSVECFVSNADDDHVIIMEADENLARAEIHGAERTRSVKAREEAWNRIQGRQMAVQDLDTHPKDSIGRKVSPQQQKKFATETAQASGMSRSAIYQELKRAEILGKDNLEKIEGTSLNRGVEMDALIKMPEPARRELIEKAAAGEKVSARSPTLKPTPMSTALEVMAKEISEGAAPPWDDEDEQFRLLCSAYSAANGSARMRFIEWAGLRR